MPSNENNNYSQELISENPSTDAQFIEFIDSFPPEQIARTFFLIVAELASYNATTREEQETVLGMLKSKELQHTAVEVAKSGGFEALMEEFGGLDIESVMNYAIAESVTAGISNADMEGLSQRRADAADAMKLKKDKTQR